MTLSTKEDFENARNQAQWAACHELSKVADLHGQGGFWTGIAKAMFHAGQAYAYYQASDIAAKAFERKKASTNKPGEKL